MNPRLERYLRATRAGFESAPLDDEVVADLRLLAEYRLPGLRPVPDILFITSRQRRWEFLQPGPAHTTGLIVADLALEATMLDLQHLMMVKHDGGPALAWLLAADACRHENAEKPYLLFASAALEFSHKLRSLISLRERRSDDVTRRFLLFHELGHVAIERQAPWVEIIQDSVTAARLQFMAHVERRLAAPQVTPDGYTHGSGIALEETPLEMLVAGFGRYIEVGGQAGPLDDELTCDWFAALAIAGVATSFLTNPDHMPVQPGSWRKAADGIFLVTRLVRLLGFLSGIRHFARGVTGGAAPYWQERYQVELSIRLNVMSNLAAGFNEIVLAQLEFAEGSGFPHHVEKAQIIAAFNAALARDARLFHDRIFRLFDVLEPARDPVRLEADLACGHTSGLLDDPRRAADELRAQLERQIAMG